MRGPRRSGGELRPPRTRPSVEQRAGDHARRPRSRRDRRGAPPPPIPHASVRPSRSGAYPGAYRSIGTVPTRIPSRDLIRHDDRSRPSPAERRSRFTDTAAGDRDSADRHRAGTPRPAMRLPARGRGVVVRGPTRRRRDRRSRSRWSAGADAAPAERRRPAPPPGGGGEGSAAIRGLAPGSGTRRAPLAFHVKRTAIPEAEHGALGTRNEPRSTVLVALTRSPARPGPRGTQFTNRLIHRVWITRDSSNTRVGKTACPDDPVAPWSGAGVRYEHRQRALERASTENAFGIEPDRDHPAGTRHGGAQEEDSSV